MKKIINCCVKKLVPDCQYRDDDGNCKHPKGEECAGHIGI